MRVALTMRITGATGYIDPRDSLAHDWIQTLQGWGMTPLLIPNGLEDPANYVSIMQPDLIVLTGGDDPSQKDSRNQTEVALTHLCLSMDIPLLGVCRGMQFLNHHFEGSTDYVDGHVASIHGISIVSPQWQRVYGENIHVNSFHELGIAKNGLGKNLAATATVDDHHIEAFIHTDKPVAGVMWHPERKGAPAVDQTLFRKIISREWWLP